MDNSKPRVGEWYSAKGFEFRVDHVMNGEVYYVRFEEGEEMGKAGRVSIAKWLEEMPPNSQIEYEEVSRGKQ